ncbi:MAG: hypothetical protein V1928_00855 [Parcubacteria group bacterium]
MEREKATREEELLSVQLSKISPLGFAEEIDPLFFRHPRYKNVYTEIGYSKTQKKSVKTIWVSLRPIDKVVVLSYRNSNEFEKAYCIAINELVHDILKMLL